MLKGLAIKNFQGHKQLVVSFDPYITTIKGPTDSGKSAILRALRWVCLNDNMSGDHFIHHGEERVVVKLKLANDVIITRAKTSRSSGNLYKIFDKEFKAFGTGIPEPIKEMLGLSPINFQGQLDSHFWLSESPAEVSRQLNSVIDLSIIDTSLSNIATSVRNAQSVVQVTTDRLQQARTYLSEMGDLETRTKEFKLLKTKQDGINQLREDRDKLDGTLTAIYSNKAGSRQKQFEELEVVTSKAEECFQLQEDLQSLRDLVAAIEDADGLCEGTAYRLLKKQYEEAIKGQLCPTCNKPL